MSAWSHIGSGAAGWLLGHFAVAALRGIWEVSPVASSFIIGVIGIIGAIKTKGGEGATFFSTLVAGAIFHDPVSNFWQENVSVERYNYS